MENSTSQFIACRTQISLHSSVRYPRGIGASHWIPYNARVRNCQEGIAYTLFTSTRGSSRVQFDALALTCASAREHAKRQWTLSRRQRVSCQDVALRESMAQSPDHCRSSKLSNDLVTAKVLQEVTKHVYPELHSKTVTLLAYRASQKVLRTLAEDLAALQDG